MMITPAMLYAVLRHIRERNPYISGYRKWPDGVVRRYIEWLRASERSAR
jgi:hypothetical protein